MEIRIVSDDDDFIVERVVNRLLEQGWKVKFLSTSCHPGIFEKTVYTVLLEKGEQNGIPKQD